jgi:MoaA/NifB/PqqE/SkfB family radical SAM enzyme
MATAASSVSAEQLLLFNAAGILNLHTDKNPFQLDLANQDKVRLQRAAMKLAMETVVHRIEREGQTIEALKQLANYQNDLAEYRTAQIYIDRALDLAEHAHVSTQDSIAFMMTDRCNLRCKHCFIFNEAVFKPVRRPDELTADEYVEIFGSLQRCNRSFSIHITGGGEVFARTDFEEIIHQLDYVNDGSFRFPVSMQTNGHFPERLAQTLAHAPKFFNLIQFSMDGLEDAHNAVRGQNNFTKLMHSIQITKMAGIDVNIITTILPDNIDELAKIKEFGQWLGVKNHRFQLFFEGARVALSPEHMRKAAPFISERDRSLVYHDSFAPGQGCLAGIRTCVVRPDGSIETCRESYSGNVPRMKIVNLRDYDLDFPRALASAEAFAELRKVQNCIGCAAFCDR